MNDRAVPPKTAVVALPPKIDVISQEEVYDRLYAPFVSGASVVVADFTATVFCDRPSLRRLAGVGRRAAARGSELRFAIPPGSAVRRLAELFGPGHLPPIYPSLRAARMAGPGAGRNAPGWHGGRAGGRASGTADVIDLIAASDRHIQRWQAWLGELRRHPGTAHAGPGAALTWDTLAVLLDLGMSADDEICGLALYGTSLSGLGLLWQARGRHEDIREMAGETSLQPPGSSLWWSLAAATLAAWAVLRDDEEHGPAAGNRRLADPALRHQLAHRWRAFREARIRDRYPDAPPHLPTCQLRQTRPAIPLLADITFNPLACTCPACTHQMGPAPAVHKGRGAG